MEAKIIQMEFNIIKVSLINGLDPIEFISFLNNNHSDILICKKQGNLTQMFIGANNIKTMIKSFNKSKMNFIQKVISFFYDI